MELNNKEMAGTTEVKETKEFNPSKLNQIMSLKDQVQSVMNEQKKLQEQIMTSTSGNGFPEYLKTYVLEKSEEEINSLSKEDLIELYKDNEDFTVDVETDEKFLKDYLIFIKESEQHSKEFDELVENFQKEIGSLTEEIQAECEKFGDIRGYIKDNYYKKLETAEGAEKIRLEKAIEAIDDSLTLNRIYDLYSSLNPINTLNDYKDKDRQKKILKNYSETVKELRLRTDLSVFKGLERMYLDKKYHKYPSLFIFIVMKYVAYSKLTASRINEGLFIVSLAMTLQGLYTNTLTDENKEKLISNIERILDLFYK